MDQELSGRHMAAMCLAADNLLRQLASEGMDYRITASGGTATTLHLTVRDLTPEISERIVRCLRGIGAELDIVPDAGEDRRR
ncbi:MULTISPECIES: hypothetical protein [unclassified Methylobacterium]|uniref:hypothetical protein n=1 Tax=unclassified Methylobacterium TaxID=2615210 RepID=UPI0012E3F5F1|nr:MULTISPECIES: hypothetical protein [unclassified Methylobacterium]